MKGKKIIGTVGAVTLCLPMAIGLVGCGKGGGGPKQISVNPEEVYATSAASSAMYLKEISTEPLLTEAGSVEGTTPTKKTRPEALTDYDIDGLVRSLTMFDQIIKKGDVAPTKANNDKEASGKNYDFKLSLELPKITGEGNDTFVLYYNETATKVENEGNESKSDTTLEGIMTLNSAEFPVKGNKKIETEDTEGEAEISFETYTKNFENRIKVKQSIEVDTEENEEEISYKYTIEKGTFKGIEPQSGNRTEKDYTYSPAFETKVEVEQEEGKNQIEFQFANETTAGKLQERIYELEQLQDGKFNVKVFNSNTMQEDTELEMFVEVIGSDFKITYGKGEDAFSETISPKTVINGEKANQKV